LNEAIGLVRRSTETVLLRGSTFIVSLGLSVVISRGLGPEGRGYYSLAILSALVLATLGKLGLEHANVYLLGTVGVPRMRLASQNALVSLVTGLFAIVVLLLAPSLLPAVFGDMPIGYLALAGFTIPFTIHSQLASGLQNLTGQITWQFRALLGGALIQLILAGALAIFGRLDVATALGAYLVGGLATWILLMYRDRWQTLQIRIEQPLLVQSLRYALVIHVGLLLLFLETRLNLFMVKAFLDTTALGQYSLSVSLAEAVLLAADSLAITLLPQQTAARLGEAARLGWTGAKVGGTLTAILMLPGLLLGPILIPLLFGNVFAPSYPPFAFLLPGMIFLAMHRYCGAPILRANDPWRFVRIISIGVLVNVGLNVWWIPSLGLTGAALATTVSYAVTAILLLRWTHALATTPLHPQATIA